MRRGSLCCLLAVSLFGAASCSPTGTVKGVLVDQYSGRPIAKAGVRLAGERGPAMPALTDAEGRFQFAKVTPGKHKLNCSPPACQMRDVPLEVGSSGGVVDLGTLAALGGRDRAKEWGPLCDAAFDGGRPVAPEGRHALTFPTHLGWGLTGTDFFGAEVRSPALLLCIRQQRERAGNWVDEKSGEFRQRAFQNRYEARLIIGAARPRANAFELPLESKTDSQWTAENNQRFKLNSQIAKWIRLETTGG